MIIPYLRNCQFEHEMLYTDEFQLAIIKNFISEKETDIILKFLSTLKTNRSITINTNGENEINENRTASNFINPNGQWATKELMDVDKRICKLFNWKACNIENWSFIKYGLGQRYNPHQDYLSESVAESWGYHRVGTLILYLKNAEMGGHTIFPLIKQSIVTKPGDAIFFNYEPNVTVNSLHGGSRVVKGEKIIATRWFKNVI